MLECRPPSHHSLWDSTEFIMVICSYYKVTLMGASSNKALWEVKNSGCGCTNLAL